MPIVYGTVYVSDRAHYVSNFNTGDGFKAAKVARNQLENALNDAGALPDVVISDDHSFDPDDYGCDTLDCAWRKFWKKWLPGHPDESEDFNLMLLTEPEVSGNPGGATGSATDHPAALSRGSEFIDDDDLTAEDIGVNGSDREGYIRTVLSEVGHNLGMAHGDGVKYYANSNDVYATPMGCPSDPNNCNEFCTEDTADYWEHLYSDCEVMTSDEL